MRARVIDLCFRDACFIAANIRRQDWDECRCQMVEENKFALASLCYFGTAEGLRWCVQIDGQPVAAFGAIESGPGLYQLWMWSTDRLRKAFPTLVKFMDREFRDIMNKRGANRVEVRVMETHDFNTLGWLTKAGAIELCALHQYGKNGETFRLYAWWKGMPNAKDLCSGYARVRNFVDSPSLCSGNPHKRLVNDIDSSPVSGVCLPVNTSVGVSDR